MKNIIFVVILLALGFYLAACKIAWMYNNPNCGEIFAYKHLMSDWIVMKKCEECQGEKR